MTSAAPPQAGQHYRVLARKYRPSSFDDLIGQEAVVRTVSNAFETGRIPQAWILTGVRGVGKTTTARILARALNYELPDGSVKGPTIHMPVPGVHCQAIMESRHMDVLEMDAASHTGVDDVRQINDSVRYAPASARYKVYIIDEVHMLSTAAFNAFLKTLEEPPEHAKFVFATTEIRKVPVTVLSRCQRFDLRRVDADVLMAHLAGIAAKENVEAEPEALGIIARAAEGSVRDSLSLFDQAIAHAAGTVRADAIRQMLGLADRTRVIDLFDSLARGDIASAFKEFREQYDTGADPIVVLSDLAEFVNFVTRVKIIPATPTTSPLAKPSGAKAIDGGQSRLWRNRAAARPRVCGKTLDAGVVADVSDAVEGHYRGASARCGPRWPPKWCWCASPMSPTCRRRTKPSGCLSRMAVASPVIAGNAMPRGAQGAGQLVVGEFCAGRFLDAIFACASGLGAAGQRGSLRASADDRAGVRSAASRGGAADCQLSGTGGARRRKARSPDQIRARGRRPPGSYRGRPARSDRWSAAPRGR